MTFSHDGATENLVRLSNERKLRTYLLAMIVLGVAYVSYYALIGAWLSIWGPAGFVIGLILSWALITRAMASVGGLTLAITLWAAPAWCALVSGGIWSPLMMWLIPPILIAGFLNGMKASIFVGTLSIGSAIAMYLFNDDLASINELTDPFKLTLTMLLSAVSSMIYVIYFSFENNRQTKRAIEESFEFQSKSLHTMEELDLAREQSRKLEAEEAERLRHEAQYREESSRKLAVEMEQNVRNIYHLAESVRGVSDMMDVANRSTQEIAEYARDGGRIVQEAIGAMTVAQDSSAEIADISSTISEIAFQTNMLALNAQIEAARAGQAGRGFAVVASEVQALAHRAANAAQIISKLTETSGINVNEGASSIARASEALKEIIAEVDKAAVQISQVTQTTKVQAETIEKIKGASSLLDTRMQDLSRPFLSAAE